MTKWLRSIPDDIAYVAPFAAFLGLLAVGATWPSLFVASYAARAVVTALLLILLWPHYTKIRWSHLWLGVVVGVAGIVQWVGMQLWLERRFAMFAPSPDAFNPQIAFHTPATFWAFVAVRMTGAVLVVPVMEELFWRDFLWRQFLAPADFKLAAVGEWGWFPFLAVAAVFSTVHGVWWPTAVVWGLMIGTLLVHTRSLGACIVAHAVTNLLLAVYVLKTHRWDLW